jgi:hypothetical protein
MHEKFTNKFTLVSLFVHKSLLSPKLGSVIGKLLRLLLQWHTNCVFVKPFSSRLSEQSEPNIWLFSLLFRWPLYLPLVLARSRKMGLGEGQMPPCAFTVAHRGHGWSPVVHWGGASRAAPGAVPSLHGNHCLSPLPLAWEPSCHELGSVLTDSSLTLPDRVLQSVV